MSRAPFAFSDGHDRDTAAVVPHLTRRAIARPTEYAGLDDDDEPFPMSPGELRPGLRVSTAGV